ncbi:sensor histidine kinase [Flavobacterium sp. HTF]|uniref:sensor histidine kinase n=1 Tax=Flavobacterium sp. HTF TaxID=2170732 RepID=UPI000D5DB01B|nr:ATP-binding protein [Flavobacterium sp. HTF]PWB28169.1 histidine kinase [Flavobacterium sp. HTF]
MLIPRIITVFIFLLTLNCNVIFSQSQASQTETKQETTEIESKKDEIADKKIVSLLIILVIMLMVLFYFYYQNNKLKRKNKQKTIQQKIQFNIINSSIDGQENERKKIALFLHDNINSLLSSVGLHLNTFSALNNIESDEINKAKIILEEAHDRLRDMSHELIPTLLVRFGLIYALEDLCEKNSNSNIDFQFSSSVPTDKRYNERFEMKIYFITSELFSNIIKHSKATKARISLNENKNQLIIIIHDNGIGFDADTLKETEGFGLNRIRARIKKLKGNFKIISRANENTGCSVRIKVPIS